MMTIALDNFLCFAAEVVAQLAERLHPIPEIRGSNPVIDKILYWTYWLETVEKTNIKKKEAGIGHLFFYFQQMLVT